MSASSSLSADVVAAIDDLELAARIVVEGLRTGGHRSPFHGYSTEFRQHRPYRAGDDLKYLDWKLFARSDRLYTRQFRETTNLSVLLALDTSASMDYPEHRDQQVPIRPDRCCGIGVSRRGAGACRRPHDHGQAASFRTCRRAAGGCTCGRCWHGSTVSRRRAHGTRRMSSPAARNCFNAAASC